MCGGVGAEGEDRAGLQGKYPLLSARSPHRGQRMEVRAACGQAAQRFHGGGRGRGLPLGGGLAPNFILGYSNKHSRGGMWVKPEEFQRKTASGDPLARTCHVRATPWGRAGLTSQSSRFCTATNRQPVT